jgi:hypothetical protein
MKQYFFLCTLVVCINAIASETHYSFNEYDKEQLEALHATLSKNLYFKRSKKARSRVASLEQNVTARRSAGELFGPDVMTLLAE